MIGQRLPDGEAKFPLVWGSYWFLPERGIWFCVTPNGLLVNLGKHEVEMHEDGTISVSPSILVSQGSNLQWHGYLERGIWREV